MSDGQHRQLKIKANSVAEALEKARNIPGFQCDTPDQHLLDALEVLGPVLGGWYLISGSASQAINEPDVVVCDFSREAYYKNCRQIFNLPDDMPDSQIDAEVAKDMQRRRQELLTEKLGVPADISEEDLIWAQNLEAKDEYQVFQLQQNGSADECENSSRILPVPDETRSARIRRLLELKSDATSDEVTKALALNRTIQSLGVSYSLLLPHPHLHEAAIKLAECGTAADSLIQGLEMLAVLSGWTNEVLDENQEAISQLCKVLFHATAAVQIISEGTRELQGILEASRAQDPQHAISAANQANLPYILKHRLQTAQHEVALAEELMNSVNAI